MVSSECSFRQFVFYSHLFIFGTKTHSIDIFLYYLQNFTNRPKYIHFIEFFILYKWGLDSCEIALNSTALQKLLKSHEKFDVVLTEQFNSDCSTGVAWKLQEASGKTLPVIGLSSCTLMPWHYNRLGMPVNPSYIPALFLGLSDKMSFLERLHNWISVHGLTLLYK